MSKRMYDTGIVQQSWYMELAPRQKALWWQLHAMMDCAGVFEINERMLDVMFGEHVTRRDIFESFGGRVQPVPNHPDKGIFVDYVAWTNPRGLSKSSPSQRAIMVRLDELGITPARLNDMARKKLSRPVRRPEPDEEEPQRAPRARFRKPSVEEVAAYIREIGAELDAAGFVDYYTSSADADGRWLVGKRPMRDWKAAVRNWERMRKERGGGGRGDRGHSSNWRGGSVAGEDAAVL